jgi:hypothetical protein
MPQGGIVPCKLTGAAPAAVPIAQLSLFAETASLACVYRARLRGLGPSTNLATVIVPGDQLAGTV